MSISGTTTVRDVTRNLPQAVRLFEKLGIDYCCGGGSSLEQACAAKGLQVSAVTAALQTLQEVSGPQNGDRSWTEASLAELVRHIVDAHHTVVRREIPRMTALIGKMSEVHGANRPEFVRVRQHVQDLAAELESHMYKEEEILFPYVVSLEQAVARGGAAPHGCFHTVTAPIGVMEAEHQAAGSLLASIRAELEDRSGCGTCQEFFRTFDAFEADLHRHIHLENNILFPRAVEMEAATRDLV